MTPLELYCLVTQLINAVTSFSLASYVLAKNPRPILNRTFGASAGSVGLWSSFYILWLTSQEASQALFWNRMLLAGCVPIPSFFLHFVISLTGISPEKRRVLWFSYALSALTFLSIPTSLLITGVTPKMGFRFWANPGPMFFVYMIHYLACFFYTYHLMYQALRTAMGNRRNQIKYVFLGTSIALLGGSTNFPLWYNIPIPPIGNVLVAVYVAMAAYAILQHHLMDINVVVRKSLVYSLLITLLTAGYFGLVYGVERALQFTLGYRTIWVSLGAFALMALAFQPLKGGIQKIVDWLIFRVPQEELARRMERLEQQALQTEKFKAVSTLAAGMAHEIKNPLTAIQTFAEYLPEKHKDAEFVAQCHQVLIQETKRIREIVQDVLDFAKPRAPQTKLIDLASLIHSTVDLLSGELLKQNIRWTVDCHHNGAALHADSDQLRQVLINLIQNAADAMPSGGQLKISTQDVNSHLELTVSDTGCGIPPALLPKIFDPFVTTKPDGNGLGLAMVYSILQAHRGTIRADSQPHHGTTFTVSLPL